jgi:hypothetical protein
MPQFKAIDDLFESLFWFAHYHGKTTDAQYGVARGKAVAEDAVSYFETMDLKFENTLRLRKDILLF